MVVELSEDVVAPRPVTGERLRQAFLPGMSRLTLGLVHAGAAGLWLGPLELLRFGPPEVAAHGCSFPIEGGLLAAAPAGRIAFSWQDQRLTGAVEGYRPSLPPPLYRLTQLPLHRALTRLHLLRLRGPAPAPGMPDSGGGRRKE